MTVLLPLSLVATWLPLPHSANSHVAGPIETWGTVLGTSELDDAEEAYQFIVGLAEKSMHEVVVREARAFLQSYPRHPKAAKVRYRLATALFDQQKFQPARAELRRLESLEQFVYAAEVAFRLGQCELKLGDSERARTAFERVQRLDSEYLKLPATYLHGEAAFRCGDFGQASKSYQSVLGLKPAGDGRAPGGGEYRADAFYGLCWCAYKLEDYDQAAKRIANFCSSFKQDPRLDEMFFLLGECHLESGRHAQALAAYAAVEAGPSADGALRGAGFACAALGQHADAAQWFQRLLEDHPNSRFASEVALQSGIQWLLAGEPQSALDALAHPSTPQGPESLFWKARCHSQLGDHGAALTLLERALQDPSLQHPSKHGPNGSELSARLEVARGDALFELGRGADAAAAYAAAGSDYALHAAAVARLNDGFPAEALRLIAPIAAKPESEYRLDALLTQGEALFALQRFDEAFPLFDAVGVQSESREARGRALARAGWCLFRTGHHDQAATRFAEVGKSYPRSDFAPESLFMLGRSSEAGGHPAKAKAAFTAYLKAYSAGPHTVETSLRLARLEPGAAGEQRLEQLLKVAPDADLAAQARYDLAERQSADGRHAIATRNYRALLESGPDGALAAPATYGLAWGLFSQELYEPAAVALEHLLARRDLTPDLKLVGLELTVYTARRMGNGDLASQAFEAFAAQCTDETRRLQAAKVAAAALREAGSLGKAQRLFAKLLGITQQESIGVAIAVEQAYLALDLGDAAQAEGLLRRVLPNAADSADLTEAFFFVGEAWFEAGDDVRATSNYQVAMGSPSEDVAARSLYKCGFAMLRTENHQAAAACFKALVAQYPDNTFAGEASFLQGEALFRSGEFDQAIAPLRHVVQAHPKHAVLPKALFRLGLALAHTQSWQKAQVHLATLIQRFPDFPSRDEAQLWRGRALVEMGNLRAARSSFRAVTERNDGVLSARAHIGLGKLSMSEGNLEDALSSFLKVSVLYSHSEEVGEALFLAGSVLEKQGKPQRARAQYQELIERAPKCLHAKQARQRLINLG